MDKQKQVWITPGVRLYGYRLPNVALTAVPGIVREGMPGERGRGVGGGVGFRGSCQNVGLLRVTERGCLAPPLPWRSSQCSGGSRERGESRRSAERCFSLARFSGGKRCHRHSDCAPLSRGDLQHATLSPRLSPCGASPAIREQLASPHSRLRFPYSLPRARPPSICPLAAAAGGAAYPVPQGLSHPVCMT